jgi:hypothetical protein
VHSDGADNFAPLSAMTWQVHVYSRAKPELVRWCTERNIELHEFAWTAQHGAAGLERDALYFPIPMGRSPTPLARRRRSTAIAPSVDPSSRRGTRLIEASTQCLHGAGPGRLLVATPRQSNYRETNDCSHPDRGDSPDR